MELYRVLQIGVNDKGNKKTASGIFLTRYKIHSRPYAPDPAPDPPPYLAPDDAADAAAHSGQALPW